MAFPRRVYRVSEQKVWNPKTQYKYSILTDCPLIHWSLPPDFTENLRPTYKITPAKPLELSITPNARFYPFQVSHESEARVQGRVERC